MRSVPVLGVAVCGCQCEGWVCERPALTNHQCSGLTYRRLPGANDKCLLNSFLNVGNKLLVA